MTIEFVCGSAIDFDPSTGQSATCEHRLVLSDDKAGAIVECPACQNFVEVPEKKPVEARPVKKPRPRSTSQSLPAGVDQIDSVDLFDERVVSSESKLQYESFDGFAHCRACGARLSNQALTCPNCGASRRKIWSDDPPLDSIKIQMAGCQRWLIGSMSEGQSPRMLKIVGWVMVGLLSLVLVSGGFLAGGVVAVAALLLAGGIVLMYWRISYQCQRIASTPAARLVLWQQVSWGLVLVGLRLLRWRVPMSELSSPSVLDYRGQTLSNDRLAMIEGLAEIDVLDLEGVGITDEGLRYLRGLHDLDYLVLTKNDISDEGVFRLQQTIPKCWIWY